jgi:hypothetical protein
MNVIGYDPVMSAESFKAVGLAKVELEQIWKNCDFITCHTPLTPETSNLLNETTMSLCKKGVLCIMCMCIICMCIMCIMCILCVLCVLNPLLLLNLRIKP